MFQWKWNCIRRWKSVLPTSWPNWDTRKTFIIRHLQLWYVSWERRLWYICDVTTYHNDAYLYRCLVKNTQVILDGTGPDNSLPRSPTVLLIIFMICTCFVKIKLLLTFHNFRFRNLDVMWMSVEWIAVWAKCNLRLQNKTNTYIQKVYKQ